MIDLAIKEINQHTNIQVDFKVIKRNGQVFSLEFEVKDKQSKQPYPTPSVKLNFETLSFAQVKALKLLTNYRITQELALEMICRATGSEIKGFEDWYFEEIIQIFESKTNQVTANAKAGTFVNWYLKKKIFEQGDHFAIIMERLQTRKKQIQNNHEQIWLNRIRAKEITAEKFRNLIRN